MSAFYELSAIDKNGEPCSFSILEGKVVLIVNVASKCLFTPQYEGLEELFETYKDRGLVILGFPCNQFLHQEPGTDAQISEFCRLNYSTTFPIFKKIKVNGKHADPVYKYLKSQKSGILGLSRIFWNFEKFLIDYNGNVIKRYSFTKSPESIKRDIEKLL